MLPLPVFTLRRPDFMLGDYMEWKCLTNPDFCIFTDEMPIRESLDIRPFSEDDDIDSLEEGEEEYLDVLRRQTKIDNLYRQVFDQITMREQLLGCLYPFVKNGNRLQLKARQTSRMRLYIFFLMCSHLGSLSKKNRVILTKDFERIGKSTASSLYPQHKAIIFGTSDRYRKGNLKTRLQKLTSDINAKLDPEFSPSPHNNGDAGLDIVAWQKISPNETATHLPLALFQCGCAENIETAQDKQYECSLEKWYRKLHHIVAYPHMITPLCTRENSGSWYKQCDVTTVWIDRIRLMWILSKKSDLVFSSLKSNELAIQALSKDKRVKSNEEN